MPRLPLEGVRVLDLSWLLPGPFCSMILADLGADIIKVEVPKGGDYYRDLMPASFALVNRGKRSLTLDLKSPDGLSVLNRLIAASDVLIEGFRPGVAERLGFGWTAAHAANPSLVYASFSGFGQDGPLAKRPGHDVNYMALAGGISVPEQAGEVGNRGGLPVGDLSAALYGAINILAALRPHARGNNQGVEGCYIDVSITESVLHLAQVRFADYLLDPEGERRWRHLFPGNGVFETSDGRRIALGLVEPKFWAVFWRSCERPVGTELGLGDIALRAVVAKEIKARSLDYWRTAFDGADMPFSTVNGPSDALNEPHFLARGVVAPLDERPDVAAVALPGRMAPLDVSRPSPSAGEHSAAILAEVGYGTDEVAALFASRIVQ